jgi:DNA-binding LacI/PurR family transcriptional regulator
VVRVTVKDVARRSGLSLTTVSRVLNGLSDHFTEQTRARVMQAVQELDYRPHSGARAVRRGRFGSAALVLSAAADGRSTLPDPLLRGVTTALEAAGMHLTIAMLPDEKLTSEGFVPKILREWTADGLLINYNKLIPPRMIRLIQDNGVPSVWLNRRGEHDCVRPHDLAAGREAARRLIQAGHRRIAYVSFSYKSESLHYSEVDRREGCCQALREAGLTPRAVDRYNFGGGADGSRADMAGAMLARSDRPTGMVVYGASSLGPIICAALQRGLHIPRDLSFITFHGRSVQLGLAPTAMTLPQARIGAAAVEMLTEKIDRPQRLVPARLIEFGFSEGETLAAPRAAEAGNRRE